MREHILDKYSRFGSITFSPSVKQDTYSFVKSSYNKTINKVGCDIIYYEKIYREGFYKIVLLHETDDTTPKVLRDQSTKNDLFQYITTHSRYIDTRFHSPDIFFDKRESQYLIISEDDYNENKQLLLNNLNAYIKNIIHIKPKCKWNKIKPSSIKLDISATLES